MRCVTVNVLQTKADAQCDKSATVVARTTTLTTFATIDVPWRGRKKSTKFGVWDKVPQGGTFIFGDNEYPSNSVAIAEGSVGLYANNQLDTFSHFDRTPSPTYDRQTQNRCTYRALAQQASIETFCRIMLIPWKLESIQASGITRTHPEMR